MFLNVTIPVIRVMWSQYLAILKLAANSESYNRCTVVLLYYVGNETKKNHLTFPKQNKLKEYPNTPNFRNDMIARWNCGLEVYGWDMSTTHATSNPRTRLGDKWREPSKEPFLKQQPFERKMWNLDKRTSVNLGGTLVKPSAEPPQRTRESPKAILPRNLYYGSKNPKAIAVVTKNYFPKILHPGRLTWNLRIHPFRKENDLPNHHFQVLC